MWAAVDVAQKGARARGYILRVVDTALRIPTVPSHSQEDCRWCASRIRSLSSLQYTAWLYD
jgi:hypothetical protein